MVQQRSFVYFQNLVKEFDAKKLKWIKNFDEDWKQMELVPQTETRGPNIENLFTGNIFVELGGGVDDALV